MEYKEFGRTGHRSSRVVFGAAAFSEVTQQEADRTLGLLLDHGINHIDTARSYGDSELHVGPWMKSRRSSFFLASKTGMRTKAEALEELKQTLHRLKTDYLDLWQLHFLVDPEEWEVAMGEGGALEAAIEAKEQGLVRFLGVTGHGVDAPKAHLKSLEVYDFDAVLFPYNFTMLQNPAYKEDVSKLLSVCKQRNIAVQTIKALARGEYKPNEKTLPHGMTPSATKQPSRKPYTMSFPISSFFSTVQVTLLCCRPCSRQPTSRLCNQQKQRC